jgi:anti-anti-sigma factor
MTDLAAPVTPAPVEHECQIVSEHFGPVRVVHVSGRFDWATAPQFCERVRDQYTDPAVILDLSLTTTIDSAGTGALLTAAAEAMRRGQQLVVVSVDPIEVEVLRYLELNLVAPVFASLADALQWLGDQEPIPSPGS